MEVNLNFQLLSDVAGVFMRDQLSRQRISCTGITAMAERAASALITDYRKGYLGDLPLDKL